MPPLAAATRRLPSAEEVTARQTLFGMLFESQVNPASIEVQILPFGPTVLAATNFVPSAEHAIEMKSPPALFDDQVEPEFVVTKILAPPQAAASRAPSADEAMDIQLKAGVLFETQVSPESVEV